MKKYLFLFPLLTITLESHAMDAQRELFRALAIRSRDPVALTELLKNNPTIDLNSTYKGPHKGGVPLPRGIPPLHIAASYELGDVFAIEALIKAGADINALDAEGQTALFKAASPEVALALLNNGIDPFIKDNKNKTAIESLATAIEEHNKYSTTVGFAARELAVKNTIEKYINAQSIL